MVETSYRKKMPKIKGLYTLIFTVDRMDFNSMRAIANSADKMLRERSAIFKDLIEGIDVKETPIHIADVPYASQKPTLQRMQDQLGSWLRDQFSVTYRPRNGENFFTQGIRITSKGKEYFILNYFDI